MRYVIIRDDDTNALTPIDYLERLYRPFLDRGLPVNLATIPNVRTHLTYGDGVLEGFLVARNGTRQECVPLTENPELIAYLRQNSGFHIVQHGYNHEFINGGCEFEQRDLGDIERRLDAGARILQDAGFGNPTTFVAPYDRWTPVSFREVARRFAVISTGWFEWHRLPCRWWPAYLWKKIQRKPHWRAGRTRLLSHPGCFLSYHRPHRVILEQIRASLSKRRLTVLVTHWWEFFRNNEPDEPFIEVLHQTAEYLQQTPDISVVTFEDVAQGRVRIGVR